MQAVCSLHVARQPDTALQSITNLLQTSSDVKAKQQHASSSSICGKAGMQMQMLGLLGRDPGSELTMWSSRGALVRQF